MMIPVAVVPFSNSVLELRSRFSVCEVSGHPRETISPYESDSERGNKTAAIERERERLKHHQHKYRTNGA